MQYSKVVGRAGQDTQVLTRVKEEWDQSGWSVVKDVQGLGKPLTRSNKSLAPWGAVVVNFRHQLDWIKEHLQNWQNIISGVCEGGCGRDWHASWWDELEKIHPDNGCLPISWRPTQNKQDRRR